MFLASVGLWSVTRHDYFKFGFQSASELIITRTASSSLKPFLRLARMRSSFLLSGVIHYLWLVHPTWTGTAL